MGNFKFDESYNRDNWIKHLGKFFVYNEGVISNENELIEKYKDFLNSIKWIGDLKIDDEEIGVYEVNIKNTKLTTKVKISRLCSNIITGVEREKSYGKGIFFIFYENESQYRISYVKHEKTVDEAYTIKKDFSDPKRYTFLLGDGIKVHTAETRLKSEIFSSIKTLEEAFSVEPVNKEFYQGIKKYFEDLNKDVIKCFDNDEIKSKEFSLRFLGRILFCWFLREKELIPKELFNIEIVSSNKNYYKHVLHDLFFNVLNKDMKERDIKNKIINNYEKEIPFLNGGLFSEKDDDKKVKEINNEIIKNLFDFFNIYNFTVDESSPIEIEMSIDPEMLGRIFENLLAEINPETEKSARKETGSFYTPREIVDYMVVESIKLYLYKKLPNIDKEKIDNIFNIEENEYTEKDKQEILKEIHEMIILDPACGSGAFPLGILQRVFCIIDKLDPLHQYYKGLILEGVKGASRKEFEKLYESKKFNYAYKLDILQSIIHGVDIQPIAIEVSRLRAFLSLVVDEEKGDGDNFGIKALPNLEFQFICANALISMNLNNFKNDIFEHEDLKRFINKIHEISELYYNAFTHEDKEFVKHRFEEFKSLVKESKNLSKENKKKLLSWNPFENKSIDFFSSEIQFGLDKKFDIVIGNPPYLESRNGIFSNKLKESYQNDIKIHFEKYSHLLGKGMDLSLYFYVKSLKLINDEGIISFVCTNSWLSTKYGISFQNFLIDNKLNMVLVDTDFKQFSTAAINTIISFLSFDKNSFLTLKYYKDNFSIINEKYSYHIDDINILLNYKWSILFNDKINILLSILEKLSKGLTIDKIGLKYGQGLNGYKPNPKGKILFYHKEKPSFTFMIANNKIEKLKTERIPPLFIMPRGIAYSHYCCFNKIQSYSDSYVEISPDKNYYGITELEDKKLLSIWLFYNSTLGWLLREITGRNNLGGGLLKAEAFDLQNIPCVFDIEINKGLEIYNKVEKLDILNYDKEINTEHHIEIDNIIFNAIKLNKEEKSYIKEKFIELIEQRKKKSNTKK